MNLLVVCFALQSVLLQLCSGHGSVETALKDRCGVLQRDPRASPHRDSEPPAHVSYCTHAASLWLFTRIVFDSGISWPFPQEAFRLKCWNWCKLTRGSFHWCQRFLWNFFMQKRLWSSCDFATKIAFLQRLFFKVCPSELNLIISVTGYFYPHQSLDCFSLAWAEISLAHPKNPLKDVWQHVFVYFH